MTDSISTPNWNTPPTDTDYVIRFPTESCAATITVYDDKWGSFTDGCRLPSGHEGRHESPRTACDPPAVLVWPAEQ